MQGPEPRVSKIGVPRVTFFLLVLPHLHLSYLNLHHDHGYGGALPAAEEGEGRGA